MAVPARSFIAVSAKVGTKLQHREIFHKRFFRKNEQTN